MIVWQKQAVISTGGKRERAVVLQVIRFDHADGDTRHYIFEGQTSRDERGADTTVRDSFIAYIEREWGEGVTSYPREGGNTAISSDNPFPSATPIQ